jgi:hypothetical protein
MDRSKSNFPLSTSLAVIAAVIGLLIDAIRMTDSPVQGAPISTSAKPKPSHQMGLPFLEMPIETPGAPETAFI